MFDPLTLQDLGKKVRDEQADGYVDWIHTNRGVWFDYVQRKLIRQHLSPKLNDVVLDAGAGVGRMALDLAPSVRLLYAIDFSPKSIDRLRANAAEKGIRNINAEVRDLTLALDFPDSSFDKIYSIEVLQHVHCKKHTVDVLKEFHRLTKPGGVCLTMDYSWRGKGERFNVRNGFVPSQVFSRRDSSRLFSSGFCCGEVFPGHDCSKPI
jgi:ubiquinone/menaquinone biosynthesis C-methylase UbiE